ncbi:protein of unknown function [Paraburkholderia dioscoreae]|uniref:Uncharacterized protein n=1 Tax=Paraburkholderia dioscoreae TaxID=2604047 RepID=A0A5Q4Z2F6_9BURK|nr:protein of unknown function [Paraburkholderia dioscoreae]
MHHSRRHAETIPDTLCRQQGNRLQYSPDLSGDPPLSPRRHPKGMEQTVPFGVPSAAGWPARASGLPDVRK